MGLEVSETRPPRLRMACRPMASSEVRLMSARTAVFQEQT